MDDLENREIILAILRLLKDQAAYVRNLDDYVSALSDALKLDLPHLEKTFPTEMEKIRSNPAISEQLAAIDVLLEQLRKAQG
jgi:hypothetical protein